MIKRKYTTGISDFKTLINSNQFFIDKSLLIKEFIEDSSEVILIPRPRRFGKTLNISMLKYFFDIKEGSVNLFKNLKIWEDKDIKKHLNKYPIISISFKGTSSEKWEKAEEDIKEIVAKEFKSHKKDIKDVLGENELKDYELIENMRAPESKLRRSLLDLSEYLERKYNKKVIMLIDEYDNTMHNMYNKEGFEDCIDLFRGIYGNALKDNTSLYKGLLTGIMRVAKEGIFSGANNIGVYGVQSKEFSNYFGFIDREIEPIIKEEQLNCIEAKEWYNGYNFGGNVVYNPWSTMWYLKKRLAEGYWDNTASDDLIRSLIKRGGPEIKYSLEEMLKGNNLELSIRENINLKQLELRDIYSLLLQSGYLTYEEVNGIKKYKLPNEEVKRFARSLLKEINENMPLIKIESLIDSSNWKELSKELKRYIFKSLSYYDPPKMGEYREKFYHALLLGMFVHLENWQVESNREKGLGRPDIILIKDNREIVIELKAGEKGLDNLEDLIESAEVQINIKKYGEEADKIAMSFIGKEFAMKVIQ